MTTAEHLDTIDQLRTRDFPDVRGRSDVGTSGPGYHLAELGDSRWFGDEDAVGRAEEAERTSAAYEALTHALTERWGTADVFSLGSVRLRAVTQEVAQPWGELSGVTDHVHVWRVEDRWVVVCAARWGADHSPQLLAAVTVTDPP
ncbi:hypothetical protein [Streptomyces sp. NPDC090022]|uniref:hypothetical protein n=1 Tax=Streptomyces sp. NPDC090022 TaxID=3365920 RepID=UPI00380B6593